MTIEILIPATLERRYFVRVWTCYEHQVQGRGVVDCDHFFSDVPLPNNSPDITHDEIIALIVEWRTDPVNTIILGYRIVEIEFIRDNRSQWQQESQETKRDICYHGMKTVVYTSRFGCPEITVKQLAADARFVNDKLRAYTDSRRRSNVDDDPDMRERRLTSLTVNSWSSVWELNEDQKLLKLGPAAYVVLTSDVIYKPVDGLNVEPTR